MNTIFLQLATVLFLSSVFGYLVKFLKLPLIVAYLLAGVTISAATTIFSSYNFISSNWQVLTFLPGIGLAFVLFLIGMELDLREIKSLGKPILITSLGQITISFLAGFAISGYLGFSQTESVFLGLGLSFSSTIVVVKLLLEKKDLSSLYGKLSLGILLVEDLVAITALMIITVGNSVFNLGLQQSFPIITLIVKALGLFLLTFVLSKYVLESIFRAIAKNVELLFLTAIAWCFIFTSLALLLGFSIMIGAFLAGVALASSPYHFQIQSKVKPLRDFFLTLFFVYLGSQVKLGDLFSAWGAIAALTIYAIVVKPLIFLLLLGIFGFRKHTLFHTALNLSQISEFSLVIMLLGLSNGSVRPVTLSVIAMVGVLSITVSSTMITYSRQLYQIISPFLNFFEHQTKTFFLETKQKQPKKDHVVVVGGEGIGGPVIRFLKKEGIQEMVVDFNPHVIERLQKNGIEAIYGDIADPDILDFLQLENSKVIISAVDHDEDNEQLLRELKRRKIKALMIIRASDPDQGELFKSLGADYVVLPEKVSGEFLVNKLKTSWLH